MTDGGHIVPQATIREISEQLLKRSVFPPLQAILDSLPMPVLTRRQRIRGRLLLYRDRALGRLHDVLFGSDYCDHDGCYG